MMLSEHSIVFNSFREGHTVCDKCGGVIEDGEYFREVELPEGIKIFYGWLYICTSCTKTHAAAREFANLIISLHRL